MHEQKGELPDCEECLPDLMPANLDAWRVYQATQSQYIMGFGGPISINQMAVWEYIDRYYIQYPTDVFEKVCTVSASIISDMNEESRLEREANKVK